MGKKSPSAPAPVDPVALANAQASANSKTALEQQKLNLIGTSGPEGSVRYVADPSQPGGYTQQTTLSPGQQSLYDQGNQAQNAALGVANQQIGRVGQALGQQLTAPNLQTSIGGNFDDTVKAARDAAYNQAASRLDPQFATRENQLRTRLANQGLSQNSAAYQNAFDQFGRERTDAYGAAQNAAFAQGLGAQNQGFNQSASQGTFANEAAQQGLQNQAYIQNQPLNQFNSLMSSGQVSTPQGIGYSPTQVAGTDVLGANSLAVQQQQAQAQMRAQQQSGLMGGLAQLGSAAILASDVRLKTDIEPVGMVGDYKVYSYRYLWGGPKRVGVMAQEVQSISPHAVHDMGGWLAVNYGAL